MTCRSEEENRRGLVDDLKKRLDSGKARDNRVFLKKPATR